MGDDDYEPAIVGDMKDQTPAEKGEAPGDAPAAKAKPSEPAQSPAFDSVANDPHLPVKRRDGKIPRHETLKKLSELVVASRSAAPKDDDLEPAIDAPPPKPAAQPKPTEQQVAEAVIAAKPAAPPSPSAEDAPAEPAPPPAAPSPPAPSLDPEILRLRQRHQAELEQLTAERAEFEKQRQEFETSRAKDTTYDDYIDRPADAFKKWAESIRGEPFASDEEFKNEVADFVTLLSGHVMGVPLPENVKTRLEAQQSKRAVKAFKAQQAKLQAAEAARREQERAEQEWNRAADAIQSQFQPGSTYANTYKWLAAEENPGKLVVEVIQSAARKDGTQLSWLEASKLANDYIEKEYLRSYDKRKGLLSAPAQPEAAKSGTQSATRAPTSGASSARAASPAPAAPPVAETPPPPAEPAVKNGKWSPELHRRRTREAFRGAKPIE